MFDSCRNVPANIATFGLEPRNRSLRDMSKMDYLNRRLRWMIPMDNLDG